MKPFLSKTTDKTSAEQSAFTYRDAGVDIDTAASVKDRIADLAKPTHGPQVLGGVGGFGALYQLSGFKKPVLVSSTDGVGTKSKIAAMLGRYEFLGEDLVNACVNDVITCGATPAYFLDYIGVGKLETDMAEQLIYGMVQACKEAKCALIGGETAQMPGVYANGEFDLVGFAVGVVEKEQILNSVDVDIGDAIIGLPSSGLHTNGYSLVRKVFKLDDDPSPLHTEYVELEKTLGDALLEPHRSYVSIVNGVKKKLKSIAHITGGGLVENIPRALPDECAAVLDIASWDVPGLFSLIQKTGDIPSNEMFRVFNMGLGMIMVCSQDNVDAVIRQLPDARIVGTVTSLKEDQRVIL